MPYLNIYNRKIKSFEELLGTELNEEILAKAFQLVETKQLVTSEFLKKLFKPKRKYDDDLFSDEIQEYYVNKLVELKGLEYMQKKAVLYFNRLVEFESVNPDNLTWWVFRDNWKAQNDKRFVNMRTSPKMKPYASYASDYFNIWDRDYINDYGAIRNKGKKEQIRREQTRLKKRTRNQAKQMIKRELEQYE